MATNRITADQKVEEAREKVRQWGATLAQQGKWDWHLLGHALKYAHEAIESDPGYQRPWTLLADIYHRIGKKDFAEMCLKKSYSLATPGSRFPGRFYMEVKANIDSRYPFNIVGNLKRESPPPWFEDKYQVYYVNIDVYLELDKSHADETTNILAIFANPKGSSQLRLATEDKVIRQCLERSKNRETIRLEVRHAATIDDVARALLENNYQIVQFSGHATGQGLAFENELGQVHVVPQDAFAEFLSEYSPPLKCVILNACYSDVQGKLISSTVPHTIATDGAISDDAATAFTRGFYDAVGAGKDIKFAYKQGCLRIKLKGLSDSSIPIIL